MPRILPIFLLAVAALAGACTKKPAAGAAGGRGPQGPVPVNVAQAVSKDMPLELRAIGNVEPVATVAVKAQVGGELIEVNFKEGQEVKKGQLLFTIQPKLYATQLAQAQANLARDRAAAANARRDANRQEALDVKGAASKEQLDQARAAAEAAEATVRADEALVEIAQTQLGYSTVESPIDGRTGALRVQAGNLIKANADEPMVIISQMAPIYVSFTVPEQHLRAIRKALESRELPVVARDPKSGEPLATGRLTFVNNTVDTATGSILLKATFANEDRALWPGAFVDVVLDLDLERGVTVVPTSAITSGQRGTQAYVLAQDGSAELRPVTVARNTGEEAVIQKGIVPGETVVTNGQLRLFPGAKTSVVAPGGAASAQPGGTQPAKGAGS